MDGKLDDVKGRAKEAAGSITNDQSLKNEGKADKASGKIKEKLEGAKDWMEDKVDSVKEKSH